MRRLPLPLLPVLFCMLAHAAPAHAQASGLRLKSHSEGITLHAAENGLRLQYISPALFASSSTPPATALDLSTPALRNSLRADWPLLGQGLHTSFGVSWSAQERASVSASSRPSRLNPIPFLGLDWQPGAQQNSRWRLSAEVGTAFSGGKACPSIVASCNSSQGSGFNAQSTGSGLRLNPYVNFGATFRFDR